MGHEAVMNQLLGTEKIYKENPAMRHQLASFVLLVEEGGDDPEKQIAREIQDKFNITPEDINNIPDFWLKENLNRMK